MDPTEVISKVYIVVKGIYDMVQGMKENKKKCAYLVNRLIAIVEILREEGMQKHLKGKECPKAIINLQSTVNAAQTFVTKYGVSSWLQKAASWKSLGEEYEALGVKISECVVDVNLLLTTKLHYDKKIKENSVEEEEEMSKEAQDKDMLEQWRENPEISLLIWFNNSRVYDPVMKGIAEEAKRTAILECTSIFQLEYTFRGHTNQNVWTPSNPSSVRIIINRGDQAGVVKLVHKTLGYSNIPILIYSEEKHTIDTLSAQLNSLDGVKPYVLCTDNAKAVHNFGTMSTLLYVWDDLGNDGTKILDRCRQYGVVPIHLKNGGEAMQFLNSNPKLKSIKHFRMVINRHNEPLVSTLRSFGWKHPIAVFTSQANVTSTEATFKNHKGVQVVYSMDQMYSFCGMVPLSYETVELATPMAEKKKIEAPLGSLGKVFFHKVSCSNLLPKDKGGSSDPFVVFKYEKKKEKTHPIKQTLNPSWDVYQFCLEGVPSNGVVTVEVWDFDSILSNDFEGQVTVNVKDVIDYINQNPKEMTWTFTKSLESRPGKKDKVGGTITLEVRYEPSLF